MEIQGPEPWFHTALDGIQLDLQLSWFQPPQNPEGDWQEAWQELYTFRNLSAQNIKIQQFQMDAI